jgi:hypothetical protein
MEKEVAQPYLETGISRKRDPWGSSTTLHKPTLTNYGVITELLYTFRSLKY